MTVRAEYVALQTLYVNGVRGYSEGDPVPAGAVDNCGFVIGEDVAPSGLALMPKPARNASRAAWAAYAVDNGMPQAQADDMTRDQLVAQYEEPTPEEAAAEAEKSEG